MKNWIIAGLIAAIAVGGALGAFAATRTVETTADVEVAVWRRVSDGAVFVSARPEGSGAEGWITSEELDMSGLNGTGRFHLSNVVALEVPVEVQVDVEVPAPTQAVERPSGPGLTMTTELGSCCEVEGMENVPIARKTILLDMGRVVSFARDTYGLGHQGPITLHISFSASGLLVRYREATGENLDELPDACSFQGGEHMFFTPACRNDRRAHAKEFFTRALRPEAVPLEWVGTGTMDYVVSHYVTGDTPELTEGRYRQALFSDRGRDLRLGEASEGLMGVAVAYAIHKYGDFSEWLSFYGQLLAGQQPSRAFEAAFGAPLDEFYADFEEWAADQRLILIVTGFRSCDEAARAIGIRARGGVITSNGFPHYRVPLEEDHDGDGLVCEGFVTIAQ